MPEVGLWGGLRQVPSGFREVPGELNPTVGFYLRKNDPLFSQSHPFVFPVTSSVLPFGGGTLELTISNPLLLN